MKTLFTLLALTFSMPTMAGTISGIATILDGDSLIINQKFIRLQGIDAPEKDQNCQRQSGEKWPCGSSATSALRDLIKTQPVRCTYSKHDKYDKYDRILGTCYSQKINLNKEMVQHGHATAYRHYSKKYAPQEDLAKQQKIGIWQGKFQSPYQWRRQNN